MTTVLFNYAENAVTSASTILLFFFCFHQNCAWDRSMAVFLPPSELLRFSEIILFPLNLCTSYLLYSINRMLINTDAISQMAVISIKTKFMAHILSENSCYCVHWRQFSCVFSFAKETNKFQSTFSGRFDY